MKTGDQEDPVPCFLPSFFNKPKPARPGGCGAGSVARTHRRPAPTQPVPGAAGAAALLGPIPNRVAGFTGQSSANPETSSSHFLSRGRGLKMRASVKTNFTSKAPAAVTLARCGAPRKGWLTPRRLAFAGPRRTSARFWTPKVFASELRRASAAIPIRVHPLSMAGSAAISIAAPLRGLRLCV